MKNIFTILFVAFFFSGAIAQEQQSTSFSIKSYVAVNSYPSDGYYNGKFIGGDHFHAGQISLAVALNTKKGNFHQLELSELDFKTYNDYQYGGKVSDNGIGLRYNYNIGILKSKCKRLQSFMGVGIHSSLFQFTYHPDDFNQIPYRKSTSTVYAFEITPRVVYHISPRFAIDINAPLSIIGINADWEHSTNYVGDPSTSFPFLGPQFFSGKAGLEFDL